MSEPKQPPAPAQPDEHTRALLADPQFRVLPRGSAPATTPDAFTQMLRADPRCNVIEPTGKGFIIGGQG